MNVCWDTTAVIHYTHAVVRQERHFNMIRKATHRLVARVVKNFPNKVVQTLRTRGANVHTRALAHRLKSLRDDNVLCSLSIYFFVFFGHEFIQKEKAQCFSSIHYTKTSPFLLTHKKG